MSETIPRYATFCRLVGYDQLTRFRMEQGFKPMPGAEGWQLSTPSLLLYASSGLHWNCLPKRAGKRFAGNSEAE